MKKKTKQLNPDPDVTVKMSMTFLKNLIIFEAILVSILSLIAIFSSGLSSNFYLFLFLCYIIFIPTVSLRLFWKRTVRGNKIYVSNIFNHKRSFTLDEIKEVRVRKYRNGVLRDAILLSINGEKLLKTDPHEEGYNEFLIHLYEQNIPIILDETNEKMKP